MPAAYRCREGDQKKTMQQQPEKEGEPAAWLLVLWLMRSLRGLPQNVECLQRVSQRLGRGQNSNKGETGSLKVPQQISVKWFLGNAVFAVLNGYCILSLTISADRPYVTITLCMKRAPNGLPWRPSQNHTVHSKFFYLPQRANAQTVKMAAPLVQAVSSDLILKLSWTSSFLCHFLQFSPFSFCHCALMKWGQKASGWLFLFCAAASKVTPSFGVHLPLSIDLLSKMHHLLQCACLIWRHF